MRHVPGLGGLECCAWRCAEHMNDSEKDDDQAQCSREVVAMTEAC
jgi:hypothetical protein